MKPDHYYIPLSSPCDVCPLPICTVNPEDCPYYNEESGELDV